MNPLEGQETTTAATGLSSKAQGVAKGGAVLEGPPMAATPAPPGRQPKLVQSLLVVYSRKRLRSRASQHAQDAPQSPVSPSATILLKLDKVSKSIDALLPHPRIQKRRAKKPPSGSLPRRSRRVAGAEPCSPGPVISVAQRKVMRSLGFGLQEKIDVAVQDEYGKLYGQKLNESHVSTLAAIFGWTVEEGGGEACTADLLVSL